MLPPDTAAVLGTAAYCLPHAGTWGNVIVPYNLKACMRYAEMQRQFGCQYITHTSHLRPTFLQPQTASHVSLTSIRSHCSLFSFTPCTITTIFNANLTGGWRNSRQRLCQWPAPEAAGKSGCNQAVAPTRRPILVQAPAAHLRRPHQNTGPALLRQGADPLG